MSKPLVGLQDESGPSTKTVTYSTVLGRGAFAAVYKAKCGELPCAAKILHSIFAEDPALNKLTEKFYQECDYLKQIKHPNVVQYLGVCQEPETEQPVLLMEMMDQSLTHFLEHSNTPLPRRAEVSLCHDVVLALEYLHSINIVHRDLSSNNVLLIGPGSRAKVSDFGMSRMIDSGRASRATTSLTQVPGTVAYMPHEALGANPRYTEKIDIFSFGVLAIQVMTRQFPNPTDRFKEIEVPDSPVGTATIPVLETECRKEHIDMISKSHPLLSIALNCLSLRMDDRPSARDLCHVVESLKESLPSGIPVTAPEPENPTELQNTIRLLEAQVASLQQELREMKSEPCSSCAELKAKLPSTSQNEAISSKQPEPTSTLKSKLSLGQWRTGSPAPKPVSSASSTAVNNILFTLIEGIIHVYDVGRNTWAQFPNQLTRLDREPTRALTFSHFFQSLVAFAKTEMYIVRDGKWHVQIAKTSAIGSTWDIFSHENFIFFLKFGEIVVYRYTKGVAQLIGSFRIPQLQDSSVAICNGALYFAGTPEKSSLSNTFKVLLSEILIEPSKLSRLGLKTKATCINISALRVTHSTLVSYNHHLLSVGGFRNRAASGDIFLYAEESDKWMKIGSLPSPRYDCIAEVVENQLVVVGGWLNYVQQYNVVEIATLSI